MAFLYGHAKIADITNGNNTDVAKDVFTHVMVAHVMDEKAYYCNLKDQAMSPTLVLLFGVNIPNDIELLGVGQLFAEKALSFTPLSNDPSLKSAPHFQYPIKIDPPRQGGDNKAFFTISDMASSQYKSTTIFLILGISKR